MRIWTKHFCALGKLVGLAFRQIFTREKILNPVSCISPYLRTKTIKLLLLSRLIPPKEQQPSTKPRAWLHMSLHQNHRSTGLPPPPLHYSPQSCLKDCLLDYSPLLLFSHPVLSDSLKSHGVQHTRFPCPSWSPWVSSNSCPLSRWCHLTIWSSISPFSSCSQSFPAPGSFPMSQLFPSGGQSSVVSASVLAMSIQGWFPLGWTGSISLLFRGLFKSLLQHHNSKGTQPSLWSNSHPYMKNHSLTVWTFVSKVMSLFFNMLSTFIIAFLPRSKRLLISWLQSPSVVTLEPKKIKSVTVSIVSPSIYHEVMGPDAMILVFWMLSFKPAFSPSSFTFIKSLFSSSLLSAIRVVLPAYLRLLIFQVCVKFHPSKQHGKGMKMSSDIWTLRINLQNLEDGGSIRGHTAGLSRVSLRLGRSAWQLPALQMEPCTQDT